MPVEALPVLQQLFKVYVEQETWHKSRMEFTDFVQYTDKLIRQGNIFFVLHGGRVVGYTEVWKINFHQFGRLVCGETIKACEEDVMTGNLGYVANIWIDKEYRTGFGNIRNVVKEMRRMYYQFTRDVEYHCGNATRKHAQLVKVFDNRKLKGSKYERV